MKNIINRIFLLLFIYPVLEGQSQKLVGITYTELDEIGNETTVMRRDPSDIIKVGDTYYVYYTKRLISEGIDLFPGDKDGHNGYNADVWYATSKDGKNWKEKGACVKRGKKGDWDEQSVFTPNIMEWNGNYYLFYTGVPKPFSNKGELTKSAIGLAVSGSPNGPWEKKAVPVLVCSEDEKDFDSVRVDDACLMVRDGKFYFYYKGRRWNDSSLNTKLGVAISDFPEGPYEKHPLNPLIKGGHEVMAWPLDSGVVAMINTGPEGLRRTLQYAPDGIHFSTLQREVKCPEAAGFYRPDAFTGSNKAEMPDWGIEIGVYESSDSTHRIFIEKYGLPGLRGFDLVWENNN